MINKSDIQARRVQQALEAGERWNAARGRRADVIAKLASGGSSNADSAERVSAFLTREVAKSRAYASAGVTSSFFAERRIGPTLDLDEFPPNETARLAGRAVGRIVSLDAARGLVGIASGFLVAPNLIITNNHVFASEGECGSGGIQFGYERSSIGLSEGVVFEIDPTIFFFTHAALDFTVVGVKPRPLRGDLADALVPLPLIAAIGKILVGQAVSIIQYADGGPKRYGVRDNELLIAPTPEDLFLQYSTDTLPGSSGSPAYNKDWEVVALHHSGVPEIKDGAIMTVRGEPWSRGMPDTDIHWIANEGVRVSCICKALAEAQLDPRFEDVRGALVRSFKDDMAQLPAVVAQGEQVPDTQTASRVTLPGGIQITVNGSATFNLASPAQQTAPQSIAVPIASIPVAAEKRLVFDPKYDNRKGYQQDFLDVVVPHPVVSRDRNEEVLKKGGKAIVLKYHHYSLAMHRDRRLPFWTAVNVDYAKRKRRKTREEFGTDKWIPDPRIPGELQIQDAELYDPAKKFDRGHIVRRDDAAWGDTAEEEIFANSDSFHWTNCTPQHEGFNRSKYGYRGIWGGLENQIQSQAKEVGNRMSIFAGPVLDNTNDIRHDFGSGKVLVPRRFWKILLVIQDDTGSGDARLRSYAFVLDQQEAIDRYGIEAFSAGEFKEYQTSVSEISELAGVSFHQRVIRADAHRPNQR